MVMADKELIAWLYKLYNTLIKEEGHCAKAVTTGLAIDRLEELVATKEALTEQLAAARRDAEEAETYAWELEQRLPTSEKLAAYRATIEETSSHNKGEAP